MRDATSVPPCDCDISNAWMITPFQSFVVFRHVTAQSGSYSDLTVLAAAAMESATIITMLTLLCGTNQQFLFAHSKASKRMLKKF